ncbi:carboxymuconolactone decarboxylase family protein, partial [Staphylococcus aureus]|nr:carboxymuconolactone decarboxylase family protein [Staphylococcus aureus]
MSRLNTPTTIDAAPTATHTSLKAVEKQLGRVPNMFRVVANSPAALTGYLQLSAA